MNRFWLVWFVEFVRVLLGGNRFRLVWLFTFFTQTYKLKGSWSFRPEVDSPDGDSPEINDVSPDVSESMKIGIEILIFFLSDLPCTLSGDRTYVAPQSYSVLCHVTSCYVCHVMLCHVMLFYMLCFMLRYVML